MNESKEVVHHYVAVYRVENLTPLGANEDDIIIFEDNDRKISVKQVSDLDSHVITLDKSLSVKSLLFKGLFSEEDLSLQQKIEAETKAIRESRDKISKTGGCVVIQIASSAHLSYKKTLYRETKDFDICLEGQISDDFSHKNNSVVNAVLIGLKTASDSLSKYEKVRSGSYLVQTSGKICFNSAIKLGSVRAVISAPVARDLTHIQKTIGGLIKDDKLDLSLSFYSLSLDIKSDILREFLFSWTALELLIHKIFPEYNIWSKTDIFIRSVFPSYKNNVKRNVFAKFKIIANSVEDDESSKSDIVDFRKIYKTRNDIIHGNIFFDEDVVKNNKSNLLFKKYLNKFLDSRL